MLLEHRKSKTKVKVNNSNVYQNCYGKFYQIIYYTLSAWYITPKNFANTKDHHLQHTLQSDSSHDQPEWRKTPLFPKWNEHISEPCNPRQLLIPTYSCNPWQHLIPTYTLVKSCLVMDVSPVRLTNHFDDCHCRVLKNISNFKVFLHLPFSFCL